MGQRCAGRLLDQSGGGVALAVAIHSFLEPSEQSIEPAPGKIIVETSQIDGCAVKKLSREQVAQSVRREVADQTSSPVAVLQASFVVIGRINAQVTAVSFVPRGGDVRSGEVARHERPFQLKTDENMKIVRHLIGPHAVRAGTDMVDGKIELVERNIMQGLGEERTGLWIEMPPEGQAAADGILPQPRLRLVDTDGNRFPHRKAVGGRIETLFVESMADLVQDTEKAVAKLMNIEPGGDPEIFGSETRKERVRAGVEASAPEVKANRGCHRLTELSLTVERIDPMEDRLVRSARGSANRPDQLDQFTSKGIE